MWREKNHLTLKLVLLREDDRSDKKNDNVEDSESKSLNLPFTARRKALFRAPKKDMQ